MKASVAAAVQTAFPKATKVSVPSVVAVKTPKKKLVRVPRDLPFIATKAGVQPLTQIMIGFIPINIVTTKSEMVTYTEEKDTLYSSAQQKTLKSFRSLKQCSASTQIVEAGFSLASTFSTQKEDLEAMSVLVIGTSIVEEQLHEKRREMQRMVQEKDAEIAKLTAQLAQQASLHSQESKDKGKTSTASIPPATLVTPTDLKLLIAEGIKEYQASINLPVLGYHKSYPAYYDQVSFPQYYTKLNFEKFDGINGSSHEHLAYFISACGESTELEALLIRQFMQSLKGTAFTWYTQLPPNSAITWDDQMEEFQSATLRKII